MIARSTSLLATSLFPQSAFLSPLFVRSFVRSEAAALSKYLTRFGEIEFQSPCLPAFLSICRDDGLNKPFSPSLPYSLSESVASIAWFVRPLTADRERQLLRPPTLLVCGIHAAQTALVSHRASKFCCTRGFCISRN